MVARPRARRRLHAGPGAHVQLEQALVGDHVEPQRRRWGPRSRGSAPAATSRRRPPATARGRAPCRRRAAAPGTRCGRRRPRPARGPGRRGAGPARAGKLLARRLGGAVAHQEDHGRSGAAAAAGGPACAAPTVRSARGMTCSTYRRRAWKTPRPAPSPRPCSAWSPRSRRAAPPPARGLARGGGGRAPGRLPGRGVLGRPVPGFGDPAARVVIVGLAPAAHGANRTGRMFTGDRSGLFLYAALWRAGFSDRPESVSRDDGLRLTGAWITAPVRCAPPPPRPSGAPLPPVPGAELDLLPERRVRGPRAVRLPGPVRRAGRPAPAGVRARGESTCPAAGRSCAATTSASRTPSPAG